MFRNRGLFLIIGAVLLAMLLLVPSLLLAQGTAAAVPTCTGSLPPRLTVGQQGRIAEVFSTLRNAPYGTPIRVVYAPATFRVLAGPTCSNGLLYWQIDYGGGLTGWALESQVVSEFGANRYWLAPVTPPPPPPPPPAPDCSQSLAPRLTVGARGSIVERFSTLRDAPAGNAVRTVFAPASFTVLEGPVCRNGFVFWRIDYGGGASGWALESQRFSIYGNDKYWLRPG